MINRTAVKDEADFPVVKCIESALRFLRQNHQAENWFLQMETFDPHEPFTVPTGWNTQDTGYSGPVLDWPRYKQVEESKVEIAELRENYAALVRFCDTQLGRLMVAFDDLNLWRDTAIVLTTDHGFLLGEHDWWAKNRMPFYNEVAQIPLMIYHPALHQDGGSHISARPRQLI